MNAPSEVSDGATPAWEAAKRVGFRFAFALFVLLYAPAPLGSVPLVDRLASAYLRGRLAVGALVAAHVLHIAAPVGTTYTGDGVLGWVLLGVEVSVATVVCAIWSVWASRDRGYPCLREGLRVYLRFMLASIMLGYGLAKVFCVQFPAPSNVTLLKSFGESPPMDLLWILMGASRGYQVVSGLAEVLGAVLLVFRRTTMLGALVLVGVLANVVALNVFYDVPVKIYSGTLLLTALFLLLPEARRLATFFVSNAAVEAREDLSLFASRRGRLVAMIAKLAFVVGVALPMGWRTFSQSRAQVTTSVGPLAGFYTADGPVDPVADPKRWTGVEFTGQFLYVRNANGGFARFLVLRYDAETQTVTFYDRGRNETYTLVADLRDPKHVTLSGTVQGDQVNARLQRTDPSRSLLVGHGIRWVMEPR
jgi:hypothetical protein